MKVEIEPDADYLQALGMFVYEFTQAETILYFLFTSTARLTPDVARILFSGIRAHEMITHLHALHAVVPPPPHLKAQAASALAQFQAICTARNGVMHLLPFLAEGGQRVMSDVIRSKKPAEPKTLPVSTQILKDMCVDLEQIRLVLEALLRSRMSAPAGAAVPARAWRYKPASGRPRQFQPPKRDHPNPKRR